MGDSRNIFHERLVCSDRWVMFYCLFGSRCLLISKRQEEGQCAAKKSEVITDVYMVFGMFG